MVLGGEGFGNGTFIPAITHLRVFFITGIRLKVITGIRINVITGIGLSVITSIKLYVIREPFKNVLAEFVR